MKYYKVLKMLETDQLCGTVFGQKLEEVAELDGFDLTDEYEEKIIKEVRNKYITDDKIYGANYLVARFEDGEYKECEGVLFAIDDGRDMFLDGAENDFRVMCKAAFHPIPDNLKEREIEKIIRVIRREIKKQGLRIIKGKDSMGVEGYRVIDMVTNSIVNSENYEMSIEEIYSTYLI